jgi:hypothetical protein
MRKILFISLVFSLFSLAFAQTAIPLPTGFPNATNFGCTPIGDFDGDGSVDLFVSCCVYSAPNNTNIMGVYSVKKAQYLLIESNTTYQYSNLIFGDFNGDGKNEIVVNNILYSYSATMSKKKA